jgi:hypothetical protein
MLGDVRHRTCVLRDLPRRLRELFERRRGLGYRRGLLGGARRLLLRSGEDLGRQSLEGTVRVPDPRVQPPDLDEDAVEFLPGVLYALGLADLDPEMRVRRSGDVAHYPARGLARDPEARQAHADTRRDARDDEHDRRHGGARRHEDGREQREHQADEDARDHHEGEQAPADAAVAK